MPLLSDKARAHASGLIVTVLGLCVVLEARGLGMGTTVRMGPGFYPLLLGAALTLVGVLIAAFPNAEETDHVRTSNKLDRRGAGCILLGVALFIVVGEHAGLGPATFLCVFVSAMGDRQATLKSSLLLAIAATLVAAIVFSWLLRFQLPFTRW